MTTDERVPQVKVYAVYCGYIEGSFYSRANEVRPRGLQPLSAIR